MNRAMLLLVVGPRLHPSPEARGSVPLPAATMSSTIPHFSPREGGDSPSISEIQQDPGRGQRSRDGDTLRRGDRRWALPHRRHRTGGQWPLDGARPPQSSPHSRSWDRPGHLARRPGRDAGLGWPCATRRHSSSFFRSSFFRDLPAITLPPSSRSSFTVQSETVAARASFHPHIQTALGASRGRSWPPRFT